MKNFGWMSTLGSVNDDANGYSLNPAAQALPFTEALIGSYTQGKSWGSAIYKITLGANYISSYPNVDVLLAAPAIALRADDVLAGPRAGFGTTGQVLVVGVETSGRRERATQVRQPSGSAKSPRRD